MIKVPYTVTADIAKYEGDAFNKNPDLQYIEKKKTELFLSGSTLSNKKEAVKALSRYCGFEETDEIKEIALQLEEDIAILENGNLVSICFCFASGFDPLEKLGQDFMQMHAPVADNQKLQRASDKVVELISTPGAMFRRYVWTIAPSSSLSRHPIRKIHEPIPQSRDSLFFRKETQTTVGAEGGLTFFFVKVEVVPFSSISTEDQALVVESINTMTEEVLEYKGLTDIKNLLNA